MKLKPLADRVLLKPVEAMETTASGIILSTANKEKPVLSEVVAVGPGGMVDGNEVKMEVRVGDRVVVASSTKPHTRFKATLTTWLPSSAN